MNDKLKETLKPNYIVDVELPRISLIIQTNKGFNGWKKLCIV